MARRAAVKEADVSRALRAAQKAGWPIGRMVIGPDGTITMYPHTDQDDVVELNPWDGVLDAADTKRSS